MTFVSFAALFAAARWCVSSSRGRRLLSFRLTPSPPRGCRRRAAVVGAVAVVVVVARIVGVVAITAAVGRRILAPRPKWAGVLTATMQ